MKKVLYNTKINDQFQRYQLFGRTRSDIEGRLLGEDMDDTDLAVDFNDYRKNKKDPTNITPL
ncbi:copper-transporting ATPase 1 isoform X5 [Vespula maculifrons]|uniref:Copper-transporting ATPase 1 isoform X5 n=1 Tax=Vespula maculifrons TaxID=7453 RepID=A0ABD2C9N2_VESMC